MRQFIGIQYSATGIFGYIFREEGREVLDISNPLLPNPDIRLSGFGHELCHWEYDGQITLFPGVRRILVNSQGNTDGFYEYLEQDRFQIVTGSSNVQVTVTQDGWNIYRDDELAAKIVRLGEDERQPFEEDGLDMENHFLVNIVKEIALPLYPYIMAIPVLGF